MVSFSFLNAVDATTIVFIVLLVVLIVALLVVPMFTNKKRARQTEELHRSLQPGDLIKTVGGIIGTIKEIRQVSPVDREMVIVTGDGDNKTTMVFDIQALYQVMSRNNTVVPAADDAEDDEKTEPVTEKTESADVVAPVEKAEEPAVNTVEEAVATEEVKEEVKEELAEQSAGEQADVIAPEAEEKPVKASKPKAATPAKKKPVNSKSANK